MRLLCTISVFILLTFAPYFNVIAQDEPADTPTPTAETTQPPPQEEAEPPDIQQPAPTTTPTKPPQSENGLDDEGLFEDVLEETGTPTGTVGADKPVITSVKISIDAVVVVSYKFANSSDTYSVKYHINMGGETNPAAGIINGNAKIATDISGYLAKSRAFECLLKVSIADIPYEIIYKVTGDNEAEVNVSFRGQILEDWESLCTFLDNSGAKFNTRGNPERWIGVALEKARPPLNKMMTPYDPTKTTTLKFTIPKYTIQDEGLGTADIDGTGVLTIQPNKAPELPKKPQ